ncbi:MAG: lipoyl synthase [Lentisphaeria bacterium]|nr:lipoyl synthase [Lentisphaeria bacterium]NQZ66775.1 lipoyl synthase [Lentisphaeria bacterium]
MNQIKQEKRRFPDWIRTQINTGKNRKDVHNLVEDLGLNTVCQSAKCPNINECWQEKSATLMILGDRCTRKCGFCAVKSFNPLKADAGEPEKVAIACEKMGLNYIVLTSVDRDDMPDKGAAHWVKTIQAVKKRCPQSGIEILTPDFKGKEELIQIVAEQYPVVFNHNMETCERLTKEIRSGNRYLRSLGVLSLAKQFTKQKVAIKSGIMVGLGERDDEVVQTMKDMCNAGVEILTIGQYLQPSKDHWELDRYVHPDQFAEWEALAYEIGFKAVASSPMVRSSYKAEALARKALNYEGSDWSDKARQIG